MSKLFVMAAPITQGNEEEWHRFMNQLKTERKEDFKASRKKLGVRERTFYQQTPMGGLVIVTLEGDEPEKAMQQFMQAQDEFSRWFLENVGRIHEVDFTQGPPPGGFPQLVLDSEE